jgi:hypothetical protein
VNKERRDHWRRMPWGDYAAAIREEYEEALTAAEEDAKYQGMITLSLHADVERARNEALVSAAAALSLQGQLEEAQSRAAINAERAIDWENMRRQRDAAYAARDAAMSEIRANQQRRPTRDQWASKEQWDNAIHDRDSAKRERDFHLALADSLRIERDALCERVKQLALEKADIAHAKSPDYRDIAVALLTALQAALK